MPRPRTFKNMVPKESERQPAIRIEFRGKFQAEYFSLNKIAVEDFEMSQTALARCILVDWVKQYRESKKAGKVGGYQQMVLILKGAKQAPGKDKAK